MGKITAEDAMKAGMVKLNDLRSTGSSQYVGFNTQDYSDEFAMKNLSPDELIRYVEMSTGFGSMEYRIERSRTLLSNIKDEILDDTFDFLDGLNKVGRKKLEFYNQEEAKLYSEIGVDKDSYIGEQRELLRNVVDALNGNNRGIDTPLTDIVKKWGAENPEKAEYFNDITEKSIRIMSELDSALKHNLNVAMTNMRDHFSNQKGIESQNDITSV